MPRRIPTVHRGGFLWKPRSSATANTEVFVVASELIVVLHREQEKSPWVLDERREEYEATKAIFVQWGRFEPDYHPMIVDEFEAS